MQWLRLHIYPKTVETLGFLLDQIDGLVQERRNSSALAVELCLSSTNPSEYRFRLDCSDIEHNCILKFDQSYSFFICEVKCMRTGKFCSFCRPEFELTKRHPIARPHRQAMGHLLSIFRRALTALYWHRTALFNRETVGQLPQTLPASYMRVRTHKAGSVPNQKIVVATCQLWA